MSAYTSGAYLQLWLLVILLGDVVYLLAVGGFRGSLDRKAEPPWAVLTGMGLGLVVGLASALVVPSRVLPAPSHSGNSLVFAPVVAAVLMLPLRALVVWARPHAKYVPTLWAGVGVGFGAAVARLVWTQVYEGGL